MWPCDLNRLESDDTEEEMRRGGGGVKLATEANEAKISIFSILLAPDILLDVETLRS